MTVRIKILLAAFTVVGALWLQPAVQKNIYARQPTAAASANGFEELKSRRSAIESMTDIDASVKADSLNFIDEAVAYTELAAASQKNLDELLKFVQGAPNRLRILQAELKKQFQEPANIERRAQQMSTLKLEQRVRQKEAELAAAQNKYQEWDDRLAEETAFIDTIPDQAAVAVNRLKEIAVGLDELAGTADTDIYSHSRLLSLQAEQKRWVSEKNLIEQRQRIQNLLIEVYTAERDVAQRAVESRQIMLKLWQAELQKRRKQEAVQAQVDAQEAITEIPLLPKVVQDEFNINIELSNELEQVTREETELTKRYASHQARLDELSQEFETAKKRIASAVVTETIGMALRSQRVKLLSTDRYSQDANHRKIRMSEISERQIALEALTSEIADPRALQDIIDESISTLSGIDREALEAGIQELVTSRQDLIQRLNTSYNRMFKLIQDTEYTEQQLVSTADSFGEFLDRHLLWIRSSEPLSLTHLPRLYTALAWIFKPANWSRLLIDIGHSFRQKTFFWLFGTLVVMLLILIRRRAKQAMKEIETYVQQQVEDSFMLTVKVLGLTLLLAALLPFVAAFLSYQLANLPRPSPFSAAVSHGLSSLTGPLIFVTFTIHLFRRHGLARAHFDWPESVCRTVKTNLNWVVPIYLVAHFLFGMMGAITKFEFSDTVAKLALMLQAIALSVFIARIFRFNGGITSMLIKNRPKSWLSRLRYIWYPVAILWPIFILGMALFGYFYSAIEIRNLVRSTIVLFFGLVILNYLSKRMLLLAHRKIALKRAIAKQELQYGSSVAAETAVGPEGISLTATLEPVVESRSIDEQTHSLLNLIWFILALAGMWTIWNDVFPALGILQDINFWSYTTVVDGVSKTVPITLGNIFLAVIVIVATVIAARNIPGLLEVILLNRLPMDPGARYAYSTVSRYLIIALGFFIAFNAIGIRWAKLQWLLAALSVGLGFGLQEIVANFICGLIVLFERPCTVGDTITIGDTSGTVTRIRIRATTVLDWDRKELIVPNKEFVVGRLINWSLTDEFIRLRVPVGIAYGSDTRLAEKLLMEAARKNKLVVAEPAPSTFFRGFGDNSLNFELRVYIKDINDWVPMLNDLNMSIDDSFKNAGVEISFPQRDVHLDAKGPLDVRVVSTPAESRSDTNSTTGVDKEAD